MSWLVFIPMLVLVLCVVGVLIILGAWVTHCIEHHHEDPPNRR